MPIKHTHAHVLHAPCTLHEKHTLYAYSIYETHNTYNTNKRTIRTLHILHTYTPDSLYMASSIVVSMKHAHRKHQGQIKSTHKIYILDIPYVRHITYTQHTEHRRATYTCTYHLHIRHSPYHTHTSLVEPSWSLRETWEKTSCSWKLTCRHL